MRSLTVCALVSSLFIAAFSRPADLTEDEFTKFEMTVDKLNACLKAYAQYKEFIPSYIYDPIEAMTDEQKKEMVQMINDYHSGKFAPKNYQDLSAVLKKSYPSLLAPSDLIYKTYQEKVAALGPKGQEFCNDQEKKLYEYANPDRIIWACNLFNSAQSSVAAANALLKDDSEADKIEASFPEAIKFMNSKEFAAYTIIVNQLKPLNCEKDRDQIFNTIKLFDKHSVLTTSRK